MEIGKLRHKITIRSRAVTKDALGGPVETPSTFASGVPASFRALSGRELIAAQATQSQVVAEWTIRYMVGVLPTMDVLTADSEVYLIEAVLPDPTNRRYLVLACSKGLDS